MWQDIVRIPLPFSLPVLGRELVIYGFGLMLVIGFLLAMQLMRRLAVRSGFDPEKFSNAALIGLISGIVGARICHILENLGEYTGGGRTLGENLSHAINISSGGLTYYGGFIAAFIVLVLYAKRNRIPIRRGMDIVAPCLMLGLAFGRIGCFLNGCCWGAVCDKPWAVHFPYHSPAYELHFEEGKITVPPSLLEPVRLSGDSAETRFELVSSAKLRQPQFASLRALASGQRSLPVHPTQLYSPAIAFTLAALLYCHFGLRRPAGRTFALMLVLEAVARFSLEMVRIEPAVIPKLHLSISMVISIGLAALGLVLWFAFSSEPQSPVPPALQPGERRAAISSVR